MNSQILLYALECYREEYGLLLVHNTITCMSLVIVKLSRKEE